MAPVNSKHVSEIVKHDLNRWADREGLTLVGWQVHLGRTTSRAPYSVGSTKNSHSETGRERMRLFFHWKENVPQGRSASLFIVSFSSVLFFSNTIRVSSNVLQSTLCLLLRYWKWSAIHRDTGTLATVTWSWGHSGVEERWNWMNATNMSLSLFLSLHIFCFPPIFVTIFVIT